MSVAELQEFERRDAEALAEEQAACPHLQGSHPLSVYRGPLTSIAWHTLNTGEEVGVCMVCLRKFLPADHDYVMWRSKRSGNLPSRAGVEVAVTPKQEEEIRNKGYGNLPYDFQDDRSGEPSDEELLASIRAIRSGGVSLVGVSGESISGREKALREVLNIISFYADTRPSGPLGSQERKCARLLFERIEVLLAPTNQSNTRAANLTAEIPSD